MNPLVTCPTLEKAAAAAYRMMLPRSVAALRQTNGWRALPLYRNQYL
ncbi:MAG TPA: hypothetical protein VLC97_15680 [Rhodanobacteraceae bacterium]|nr:hypothetical protein [Rhodanobacteraceae bacterium]